MSTSKQQEYFLDNELYFSFFSYKRQVKFSNRLFFNKTSILSYRDSNNYHNSSQNLSFSSPLVFTSSPGGDEYLQVVGVVHRRHVVVLAYVGHEPLFCYGEVA